MYMWVNHQRLAVAFGWWRLLHQSILVSWPCYFWMRSEWRLIMSFLMTIFFGGCSADGRFAHSADAVAVGSFHASHGVQRNCHWIMCQVRPTMCRHSWSCHSGYSICCSSAHQAWSVWGSQFRRKYVSATGIAMSSSSANCSSHCRSQRARVMALNMFSRASDWTVLIIIIIYFI